MSGVALPSPGMLASHYAPDKPLRLLPAPLGQLRVRLCDQLFRPGDVVLVVSGSGEVERARVPVDRVKLVLLSPDGSDGTAARRLFACLREMDTASGRLYAEPVTRSDGLWPAIADRLVRASAPRARVC